MTTYKKTGVDVNLGDICSSIMAKASDKTFVNRRGKTGTVKVIEKDGLHRIITMSFGPLRLMLNSDGIGTKTEFAERTGNHATMAYDLFAMLCDDSVRYGAEPLAVSNILDVNTLNKKVVQSLADGMVKAASDAGVSVISGEIAELGTRVSGYGDSNYNWGGTVMSVLRKEITGRDMAAGDTIVAFEEGGFRSNGISLLRSIMESSYGSRWHEVNADGQCFGDIALTPSKIYTRAVLDMLDFVSGIAHITGGGIPGKLGRLLGPCGLGADLEEPMLPCRLMLHCQEKGGVRDREAYSVWNMGQGMLVVTSSPDRVISAARDCGIRAAAAGIITGEKGIKIRSRGHFSEGALLSFRL